MSAGGDDRHAECGVRNVADMVVGLVVLAIGALALVQWSPAYGLLLVALGLVQAGIARSLVARARAR